MKAPLVAVAAAIASFVAAEPAAALDDAAAPQFAPIAIVQTDMRVIADEVEGENGFALPRVRLGARVTPIDWVSVQLVGEGGVEKPRVLDAFVAVRPLRDIELTAGISKTPLFSSAKEEQETSQPLGETSVLVQALWPNRDAGLELHMLPTRTPAEVWLRVGNGSQSVLGNDNPGLAADARVDLALGRARGPRFEGEPLGLRLGVGAHVEDAGERAGISGATWNGFVFYRAPPVFGQRSVGEAHAVAYVGPVVVRVEGALAREARAVDTDGRPDTPRAPLEPIFSRGAAAEVAWMVTGAHRVPGATPGTNRLLDGPSHLGDVELALRGERLWLGQDAKDVLAGGASGGAGALTWWWTRNLSVGGVVSAYLYDVPAIENPKRLSTWTAAIRVTGSVR